MLNKVSYVMFSWAEITSTGLFSHSSLAVHYSRSYSVSGDVLNRGVLKISSLVMLVCLLRLTAVCQKQK